MKAAILYQLGETPRYGEIAEPVSKNEDEILINVKAAAVKNLDKGKVSGHHYSSDRLRQPEVVGVDGVGTLNDGTRVYGLGISGMIAEKGLANKNTIVKIPDGLDYVTAAALPNAVMGAAAALNFRAKIKPGDIVFINGATGVTGKVAVQVAKYYGAKKVIATGRNAEALNELLELGADEVISLKQEDEAIIAKIKEIHSSTPIDVIIDYLWGHPAEIILVALQGKGAVSHKVRLVTVGAMAGDKVQLSSGTLRSSAIEILGSGLGSLLKDDLRELFANLLPEMFLLAANGKLKIDTVVTDLKDVETAWHQDIPSGKRLVIVI